MYQRIYKFLDSLIKSFFSCKYKYNLFIYVYHFLDVDRQANFYK